MAAGVCGSPAACSYPPLRGKAPEAFCDLQMRGGRHTLAGHRSPPYRRATAGGGGGRWTGPRPARRRCRCGPGALAGEPLVVVVCRRGIPSLWRYVVVVCRTGIPSLWRYVVVVCRTGILSLSRYVVVVCRTGIPACRGTSLSSVGQASLPVAVGGRGSDANGGRHECLLHERRGTGPRPTGGDGGRATAPGLRVGLRPS
jgi:hypothetical protein